MNKKRINIFEWIASFRRGKPITILTYHSINNMPDPYTISPNTFYRQIEFIRSNYSIIRLNKIKKAMTDQESSRKVVITFDDAFSDFYELAFPVLEKFTIPSTVLVSTGFIGGFNEWDYPYHKHNKRSIMNARQLQLLNKTRLVDFGSHTVDHLRMNKLPVKEMRRQAAVSKSALEDLLSTSVIAFAYPYGRLVDLSSLTTRILSEAGYEIGFTAHWGTRNTIKDILSLRRIYLRETDRDDTIRAKIEGRYDWFPLLKEKVVTGRRALKKVIAAK